MHALPKLVDHNLYNAVNMLMPVVITTLCLWTCSLHPQNSDSCDKAQANSLEVEVLEAIRTRTNYISLLQAEATRFTSYTLKRV